MKWLFLFLGLLFLADLPAQEIGSLDWDIDSIFDEEPQESKEEPKEEEKTSPDTDKTTVIQMINRRSLSFRASYRFSYGVSPGWKEPPWNQADNEDDKIAWSPVINMRTSFDLDAQISSVFGVKSTFYFKIPDSVSTFRFFLGDFFFDYNFFNTAFIRGGKYTLKWGISPNYSFTNLLNYVPEGFRVFDSFIFKADIPIGIGGFQFLASTRANLTGGARINRENIGIGGKFNLAFRKFDLDTGAFYHHGMPTRVFLSGKTTFGNTDIYSEGLVVLDTRRDDEDGESEEPSGISGAFNFGLSRDFLDSKLSVDMEFFLNKEKNSLFYFSQTDYKGSHVSPFISGLNIALNILYRFEGKINPRFFIQTLYAVQEKSAQLIPGIRINPWSNIQLYFAVPITFGSKEGYYYLNPVITDRDNNPRRFAAVLLLTFSGNLRYTHYF
ncbi:MAG: hypothetical protein LBQ93_01115 [Treponema sp.]|jgi:hypothetical protein|nr:hypothetical protein [Treponema sp.]